MKTSDSMVKTVEHQIKYSKLFDILNQAVPVLIGIYIFFNPFPHTTSIKEICFYLSVVMVLALLLFKRTDFSFKTPLLIPFGLYVFWTFLSLFFALDKGNSIHDFYSHLLRYLILYYIVINFLCSKQKVVVLSWVIIMSTAIISIWLLYYEYIVLGHKLSTRLGGTLNEISINRIGVLTIFAIILAIQLFKVESHLYRKTILVLSFFPLCLATFMTQTRSSSLALFLSISILFHKNKKVLAVFLTIFLLLAVFLPFKNRITNGTYLNDIRNGTYFNDIRIKNTWVMFEIIKDYPIFGIGFGMGTYVKYIDFESYNEELPVNLQPEILLKYPHSIYTEIASRVGIVGLIMFCCIIFVFFRMCWNTFRNGKETYIKEWGLCMLSAFTMFLFIGFFEPIFVHVTEVVLFLILSLGTIVWKLNADNE
ncbi:MAG: O-antigen ligase family protein [Desulfobacterales bacterium]